MAVRCVRCGREYDVSLFPFGRTIQCTCGARVGLEHRLETAGSPHAPRFMVDAMLGRLARWLRVLGYDTAFDPHIADGELIRQALLEGRWIVTRDRQLPRHWTVECLVLESEGPLAQLEEVLKAFGLVPSGPMFTRCTRCNTPLVPAPRESIQAQVPPRVWARHDRFVRCPTCGRLYWQGSHTDRMVRRLEEVLGRLDPPTQAPTD